jgi:hypothetical protein
MACCLKASSKCIHMHASYKGTEERMTKFIIFTFITLLTISCEQIATAQSLARAQLNYDWAPDQMSATYQWTLDDYSLQTMSGSLERTRLQGATAEYAWRHYYPWEVVGTVQYSGGQPLGQRLLTVAGGAGYCRRYLRWTPYARVEAAMTRTSSNDYQYLFNGPQWGFATVVSVGGDYQLSSHWGVRAVQVQNEYLPFGSRGSVYWSVGAGITYRIRP